MLGYQGSVAADQSAALQAVRTSGPFQVVLSDVLLADGERGPFVVEKLLKEAPGLRPIFMSGYAPEDEALSSVDEATGFVLAKPFNLEQLAQVLRRALTASPDT